MMQEWLAQARAVHIVPDGYKEGINLAQYGPDAEAQFDAAFAPPRPTTSLRTTAKSSASPPAASFRPRQSGITYRVRTSFSPPPIGDGSFGQESVRGRSAAEALTFPQPQSPARPANVRPAQP